MTWELDRPIATHCTRNCCRQSFSQPVAFVPFIAQVYKLMGWANLYCWDGLDLFSLTTLNFNGKWSTFLSINRLMVGSMARVRQSSPPLAPSRQSGAKPSEMVPYQERLNLGIPLSSHLFTISISTCGTLFSFWKENSRVENRAGCGMQFGYGNDSSWAWLSTFNGKYPLSASPLGSSASRTRMERGRRASPRLNGRIPEKVRAGDS